MNPDTDLQAAMLRLASAERYARSALTDGTNNLRMRLLEIVEASKHVRYAYLEWLGGDVDDLKTQPITRGE